MRYRRNVVAATALAVMTLGALPCTKALDRDWAATLVNYESRMDAASGSESTRFSWIDSAAFAALMAGDHDKAKAYADEALALAPSYRKHWAYGNAIHHGHLVLGHLALLDGDIPAAEKELLAAGKTRGSPDLDNFGPNMALAKALLEKGRRKAVLAYFEECRRFWKDDLNLLNQWKAAVEKGEIPDFGPNLLY